MMTPKFSQLSSIAILLTGSLIAYSDLTPANANYSQSQQITQNSEYPEIARENYIAGCSEAVENLFADQTTQFCTCMIDEFEAELPYQQFTELRQEAEAGETPAEFSKVGEACAERVFNSQ